MDSLVATLVSFLVVYKYWALFLALFTVGVALPLPTNTLLLASGALASQGHMSFFIALCAAVLGNMAGDLLDYFLARRYGKQALKMLNITPPVYVERLERYIFDYRGPTIFLTRFVGTLEPLVSLLAGFAKVPVASFVLYAFLGNLVSDGGILYIGYFFGENWQAAIAPFSSVEWVLLGFLLVGAIAAGLWYQRRRASHHV